MFKKAFLSIFTLVLGFTDMSSPFEYDLHLFSIPGRNGRTMICFHGYGGSYKIALDLKNLNCIDSTLISFNFPEHQISERKYDPNRASFGTINELLPALFVLKKTIIDEKVQSIDLYGFSAGGGALINCLKVLQCSIYDSQLEQLGIGAEEKKEILSTIENGMIILDTPLKSTQEIIDFRGSSEELEILQKKYRENDLVPIDSINSLKGLSLRVLVHFQEKDEMLSNRDDALYIKRLQEALPSNSLQVIIGNDGGHLAPHHCLWNYYSKLILR